MIPETTNFAYKFMYVCIDLNVCRKKGREKERGGKERKREGKGKGVRECCGNIVRGETKQHSEEWRTQILIFTLAGPAVYQCLSPEQRIHRIFKRQCRVSVYKECALP
jgi:hypothetical protein